jgi:hypothetical protein
MTHKDLMLLVDAYAEMTDDRRMKDQFGTMPAFLIADERTKKARAALSDALKQVVQDAERYNWIRLTSAGTDFVVEELQDTPPSTWNEAVDKAMQEKS